MRETSQDLRLKFCLVLKPVVFSLYLTEKNSCDFLKIFWAKHLLYLDNVTLIPVTSFK